MVLGLLGQDGRHVQNPVMAVKRVVTVFVTILLPNLAGMAVSEQKKCTCHVTNSLACVSVLAYSFNLVRFITALVCTKEVCCTDHFGISFQSNQKVIVNFLLYFNIHDAIFFLKYWV